MNDLCDKCKYNYAGINGLCIFCDEDEDEQMEEAIGDGSK